MRNHILLGHLISNGDCLYATAIARQIKNDFPGCHLTWAISSKCRQVIEGNPFVDEVWEVPLADWNGDSINSSWESFEGEAIRRYDLGEFSFAFFTQITIANPHHFDGTVRPGIFRGYPGRITVPFNPTLVLRANEIEKVADFAAKTHLSSFERVILFECSSKSGQSDINPEQAYKIAEEIIGLKLEKVAFILCSHLPVAKPTTAIIDGSQLSLRETAELTKYCHLLMGCSSGISCICTSSDAKRLPMIQLLNGECGMLGSLAHDYEHFGLPEDHVIEMFEYKMDSIVACYKEFVAGGWKRAKQQFHRKPEIQFTQYLDFVSHTLYKREDFYGTCVSLENTIKRYGWTKKLKSFVRRMARKQLTPWSLAWSYPKKLARLKAHFGDPTASAPRTPPDSNLSYFPVWRPCTCEVALERSVSDYRKILNHQFPGKLSSLIRHPKLATEIVQGGSAEYLKRKHEARYIYPLYAIAYGLHLFHKKEFAASYLVLGELRNSKIIIFCQELERLYADLSWICGNLEKALEVYQDCLKSDPRSKNLLRLISHLQSCLASSHKS
jgi:hypothetical protein